MTQSTEVGLQVWWSSLVAADGALFRLLDVRERERVAGLVRAADQGRSLVAAALLRVAVGEWLGVPPAAVTVDRTCADCGAQHGRPRIVGPVRPGADLPEVSVSHSGALVVVTVAAVPVGVDVQRLAEVGAGEGSARAAVEWVEREATSKLGLCRRAVLRALAPPLGGYAAALATPVGSPVPMEEVTIRHWPPEVFRMSAP